MKRVIQSVVILSVLLCSSLAFAQYEDEPYIEGYVGANYTLPMGYLKNDLIPDSLNAKAGIGLDLGAGYHVKNNLVVGLYFNLRNMATEGLDLNHRVYEAGTYGKYFFSDLSESSFSPYLKVMAGLNFSKLVTVVQDESGPSFRELSLSPTLGTGAALGIHYKTNEYGAIFLEAGLNYDFTDKVSGEFKGIDYEWGDNNQYLSIKAGVLFGIGRKE